MLVRRLNHVARAVNSIRCFSVVLRHVRSSNLRDSFAFDKFSHTRSFCRMSSNASWSGAHDEYERYRRVTPEVYDFIQKENERTKKSIDQSLRSEIAEEILQASTREDDGVPELGPTGLYLYHSRDHEGSRRVFRQDVKTGKTQEAFFINFHEYQLHAMSISVNETYLAYLVLSVVAGSDAQVRLRHLDSGRDIPLPNPGLTVVNVEWGPLQDDGSDSLFFTTSNHKGHPTAVYVCNVHDDMEFISPALCIYESNNESVMVDVQRTKGCRYISIHASTKTSSEIRLVQDINHDPILVRPRQEGVVYHLDVGVNDDVFLLANVSEPDHEIGLSEELCLFETNVARFPLTSCFGTPITAQSDCEFAIADMDLFRDFVALYERSAVDGRQRIRLKKRTESKLSRDIVVPLPDGTGDCAMLTAGGNLTYATTSLSFHVQSPCDPKQSYTFDTVSSTLEAINGRDQASGPYVRRRVLVTSADGTKVPMSLVYLENERCENPADKNRRPTVLVGYGAYGEPVVQGFDPTIVPLLDRGFVIAYAHTRGGGELGRSWYRAGRLYQKERTIEDYIACAEALVGDLGISDSSSLTAKAFSAGAVCVAAAVNRLPSLFRCVTLTNPFLDVTRSMTNRGYKLTEHEFDEWGDCALDDRAAKTVSRYCPMANIRPNSYPDMLLVGTIDDSNVPFWHPLTFYAKIREAEREYIGSQNAGDCALLPRVLLYVEPTGGHQLHGTKLGVASMETCFIIEALKVVKDPTSRQ